MTVLTKSSLEQLVLGGFDITSFSLNWIDNNLFIDCNKDSDFQNRVENFIKEETELKTDRVFGLVCVYYENESKEQSNSIIKKICLDYLIEDKIEIEDIYIEGEKEDMMEQLKRLDSHYRDQIISQMDFNLIEPDIDVEEEIKKIFT